MADLAIRSYQPDDEASVIDLWQQCGLVVPWNNPQADIARKCAHSPDLFFVGCIDTALVATCMAGYDGHRGWIYYLAVAEALQRQGIASRMVRHAESGLLRIGCPKIDLMVRNTNATVIEFYRSIGYGDDPVVVLSKRLVEDEPHDFS
jgi:ribosomal protein S18 acetylase RimI-like enzyme